MSKLANLIEGTINDILLYAGNQNEILIGEDTCSCSDNCTNTQKHILMLLTKENFTNKELSVRLNISTAAVTKAIKSLEKEQLLIVEKDKNDARFLKYILSDKAIHIAEQHARHHNKTLAKYNELISNYDDNEKKIISDFLEKLTTTIRG